MSFNRAVLFSIGLGSLMALMSCSSSKKDTGGAGGATSSDTCDPIDYTQYTATGTPVSFQNDVMPIFGEDCTASLCHNDHDKEAGLDLGTPCLSVSVTGDVCTFATAPNQSPTNPNIVPLTTDLIKTVHDSLLSKSATVDSADAAPGVKRVAPGDPKDSFIMQKLSDTENDQGYSCTNQDDSHEENPGPCGEFMPQGGVPLCAGKSRPKFDTIANWIAQGALNN